MAYIGFFAVLLVAAVFIYLGYSMLDTAVEFPGAEVWDWVFSIMLLILGCGVFFAGVYYSPFYRGVPC